MNVSWTAIRREEVTYLNSERKYMSWLVICRVNLSGAFQKNGRSFGGVSLRAVLQDKLHAGYGGVEMNEIGIIWALIYFNDILFDNVLTMNRFLQMGFWLFAVIHHM